MKTIVRNYFAAVLTILPFLLVSCEDGFFGGIDGEGDIVQATISVDDFDGFVSTIAADIYISQGDIFEVTMTAQQNIIENLDTDWVRDGIWTIKYNHWVRHTKPVKIYITVPELTKIGLSGSGEITGETPFVGLDRISLSISGSGKIDLDSESDEMDLSISGSGDMYLAGVTGMLDCSISGSGSVNAFDLVTDEGDIHISGSGNARVNVEESLKVSISGSGGVYYRGNPYVDAHVSGSGEVKRDR